MAYVSQEMKKELTPAIKSVLKKYRMKGSIAVRHHSTLCVTLREGCIDFGTNHTQVNHYWAHEHYSGTARRFLLELIDAMKGSKFFDESDPQTDYFHVSHYLSINVGRWDRPYIKVA